jgi:hypothetical protein
MAELLRRKPGPVPKGDRSQFTLRVPKPHREVYERAALDAGYRSLSDYLAARLAEAHDLEMPKEYALARHDRGEELPLAM